MEWIVILAAIGIFSSILDKKTSTKTSSRNNTKDRKTTNEWDGPINGSGISMGSNWDKIRKSVLLRDNYSCKSCGKKDNLTVDHIVQISKGGTNNLENLQTLCKYCHESKDNRKIFNKNFNHDNNYGSNTIINPVVQKLENAIKTSSKINIKYTDINKKITYREISPKYFTKEHGVALVVSFCYLRNDKRTFRISNIDII